MPQTDWKVSSTVRSIRGLSNNDPRILRDRLATVPRQALQIPSDLLPPKMQVEVVKRRLSSETSFQKWKPLFSSLLFSALLCSALLYSSRLLLTLLYSALLFCALLYSCLVFSPLAYYFQPSPTLLSSPLLYSTLLYPTLLCSALLYFTALYSTLPAFLYSSAFLSSSLPSPFWALVFSTLLCSYVFHSSVLYFQSQPKAERSCSLCERSEIRVCGGSGWRGGLQSLR